MRWVIAWLAVVIGSIVGSAAVRAAQISRAEEVNHDH